MRGIICAAIAVSAVALLGGCAVPTHIDPQTVAAAEVASSKVFSSPVTVEYAFQANELDIRVEVTGFTGSACSFPLALSQAFYTTFDSVNHQAFRNLVAANSDGAYRVRVVIDTFDNSLIFAGRFWGSTAVAHSEIALRVSVMAPNGTEVSRQLIRGSGQQATDVGSCAGGSEAVEAAINKALRQVAEEYADRVINLLVIQ